LRLRRDLVEELLAGTDETSALARAQALGYDLERSHRVVVVEGHGRRRMPAVDDDRHDLHDRDADHGGRADDELFHAVRRAARDVGVGSLLVARAGAVVVLSDTDRPWERFRAAIQHELGGGRCRLGVGDSCDRLADLPHSYRQAQTALSLQGPGASADRAVAFDELGIYRLFAEINDPATLERFVQQWLGPLLDYDARKNTELVATLTRYLECGGSYEATAKALVVHRSTLKYRLQRIRAITGLDVSEPDVHFNLQLATRAWHTLVTLRTST
jgi:DNA-binding PucR family transcriptional regulator